MLGQPRLRRRRAARPDQLPELRQPGEAAHRLAAHARDRRPRRRLPRLRRAGRRRQRLALQRGRRGPIYPTPVVGLVGELPAARAPAGWGSSGGRRGRADQPRAPGRRRWRLRAVQAARRAPSGALPAADLGELKALHAAVRQAVRAAPCAPRTTSPRVAWRSRWPSAAWPAASVRRASGAASELFGEGPGAFVVSGPADALTRVRRRGAGDRRGRRRRPRDRGALAPGGRAGGVTASSAGSWYARRARALPSPAAAAPSRR